MLIGLPLALRGWWLMQRLFGASSIVTVTPTRLAFEDQNMRPGLRFKPGLWELVVEALARPD